MHLKSFLYSEIQDENFKGLDKETTLFSIAVYNSERYFNGISTNYGSYGKYVDRDVFDGYRVFSLGEKGKLTVTKTDKQILLGQLVADPNPNIKDRLTNLQNFFKSCVNAEFKQEDTEKFLKMVISSTKVMMMQYLCLDKMSYMDKYIKLPKEFKTTGIIKLIDKYADKCQEIETRELARVEKEQQEQQTQQQENQEKLEAKKIESLNENIQREL